MTIGNRIKTSRKAMEIPLTQAELAKKIGAAQSLIAYLESGNEGDSKRVVGSSRLASIAHVLNVDAHWLETGEGSPEPGRVPPKEKSYCKEIALAIKIMEATDNRGREKALIAVKDAIEAHQAFKNSLPRPTNLDDVEDYIDRESPEVLHGIIDDERPSNDVCRNQDVGVRKGERH